MKREHFRDQGRPKSWVWYRGQGRPGEGAPEDLLCHREDGFCTWSLVPSAYRRTESGHGDESDLITLFQHGAIARQASPPPLDDGARWISLMRHYGPPACWTGPIRCSWQLSLPCRMRRRRPVTRSSER